MSYLLISNEYTFITLIDIVVMVQKRYEDISVLGQRPIEE